MLNSLSQLLETFVRYAARLQAKLREETALGLKECGGDGDQPIIIYSVPILDRL